MLRDTVKRWARIAFWAALLFAYVMALLPTDPHVFENDKANHALAFAVLAFLARAGYSQARALLIGVGLLGFGILIELSQAVPAIGRDASAADVVADALAILGGLAAGTFALWLIRRQEPR